MTIMQDLIRLVRDPDLELVDFTLGGQFAVRGADMPQVATALQRRGADRWTVMVNAALPEPYCDGRTRQIGLRHPAIATIEETYEALHEAAHAMLFLTGRDVPGMEIMVEIASILLPITYLFIKHPQQAASGSFFAGSAAAREFVGVVQRNHLHMACAIVPMSDVNMMWRYVSAARRQQH